jgi:hypothetical protein
LSCGAVIGVVDPIRGEQGLRITGDEDIGLEFADHTNNFAA